MTAKGRANKVIEINDHEVVNMSNEGLVQLKANPRAQISLLGIQTCGSVEQCLDAKRSKESIEECKALLETVCKIEQEVKDLKFKIKRLKVDEAQLEEELSKAFNMTLKTKKLRMKLKNFMEQKNIHEQ